MKKIVWLTPSCFIDVDIKIVPELSKQYIIEWVIFDMKKPAIYEVLEGLTSSSMSLMFFEMRSKWYSPMSFFDNLNLFRMANKMGGDCIYIDSAPQLYAYYAAKCVLKKDKTVFATHNVNTPKGARLERIARYYMRKLLNNYQNFQVFSRNQHEYLDSLVKGKNVLYAPLALKDYGAKKERTLHQGIVNFLSFGHVRHYKRIDLFIDAAQMLYEETREKFKVTIAGNCPSWKEYSERIKYPDLFDIRIGYVDDNDVAELFANADYLVLPYQDLAQSGAITVAFNYGVPVITSNIPQFQEFVEEGKNGFMFKSKDAQALKMVMRDAIFRSKEDYKMLVLSTEKYVMENYSLQAIINKYVDYFNRL